MAKRKFEVSIECLVFKNHKLINKGVFENSNGLTDYCIVKTFTKDKKTYTIKEKYYGKEFYSKSFEIHDRKEFYIVTAYKNPFEYYILDTRKDN